MEDRIAIVGQLNFSVFLQLDENRAYFMRVEFFASVMEMWNIPIGVMPLELNATILHRRQGRV